MKTHLTLYHGSPQIISKPKYGLGNPHNDYGRGFYCTEYPELAKEWACKVGEDGFLNKYEFDMSGLNVLYMNKSCSVLTWLAVLLQNRHLTHYTKEVSELAVPFLMKNYSIDLSPYDVIIGYRVDDKYFNFVKRFLSNSIGLETLTKSMKLGKLGEQVVLRSENAFKRIRFVGSEQVQSEKYYRKYLNRMEEANLKFEKIVQECDLLSERLISDIMREARE